MAARKFEQFQLTLEKSVVTLFANVPIGSTGAVGTLTPSKNQGISSVVRNSAGNYTITLGLISPVTVEKYVRVLHADAKILLSTIPATAVSMSVISDLVASTGKFTIQFYGPTSSSDTTPVAADPDSGAVLLIKVMLKNALP